MRNQYRGYPLLPSACRNPWKTEDSEREPPSHGNQNASRYMVTLGSQTASRSTYSHPESLSLSLISTAPGRLAERQTAGGSHGIRSASTRRNHHKQSIAGPASWHQDVRVLARDTRCGHDSPMFQRRHTNESSADLIQVSIRLYPSEQKTSNKCRFNVDER